VEHIRNNEKLLDSQYYARYLLEYSRDFEVLAERKENDYKDDPKYFELKENNRGKYLLKAKYLRDSIKLYNKALKYRKFARKEIPLKYDIRYIEINVKDDDGNKTYNKAREIKCVFSDDVSEYIIKKILRVAKIDMKISDLEIGNLLCIKSRNFRVFIYVYDKLYEKHYALSSTCKGDKGYVNINKLADHRLPYKLTTQILLKDLIDIYKLPFKVFIECGRIGDDEKWKWNNDFNLLSTSHWKCLPSEEDCKYIRLNINRRQYRKLKKYVENKEDEYDNIRDIKLRGYLEHSGLYETRIFPNYLFGCYLDSDVPCIFLYAYLTKTKGGSGSHFVQIPALKNINADFDFSIIPNPHHITEVDFPTELLCNYPIEDIKRLYKLPFDIK
jgi:hypothetical protein